MALKRDVTYSGRFNPASTEHPQGEFKNRTSPTSEDGSYLEQQWLNDWDGFMSSLLSENGIIPNGLVDEVGASQYFEGMLRLREVSPRNNDWNGYLDPEHQLQLPAPNGYPGNSGGGEVTYNPGDEISNGIFSGGGTVSSDPDGWIFSSYIYKDFKYTPSQLDLIDEDLVPVFIKDQDGVKYFLKNGDTGVIITKVSSTMLRVAITSAIFTGGLTKLWRFFVTERVGCVVELEPEESFDRLTEGMDRQLFLGAVSSGGIPIEDITKFKYLNVSAVFSKDGVESEYYTNIEVQRLLNGVGQATIFAETGAGADARFAGVYIDKTLTTSTSVYVVTGSSNDTWNTPRLSEIRGVY